MSIYQRMREDWKVYCLMASIAVVEEFSKPVVTIKHANYKGKHTDYPQHRAIRLKMKNYETMQWWLETTLEWERRLEKKFLGVHSRNLISDGDQWCIYFTAEWAYEVLKSIGYFPSKYTHRVYFERISDWKATNGARKVSDEELNQIRVKKPEFTKLLEDKSLAAGAMIISFDLECKGSECGHISLTMSDKYKDFLELMLAVTNCYGWATEAGLKHVSVDYSIKRGIKASPQFSFSIKSRVLPEIYSLAGPLLDSHKDKCLQFHINRSTEYKNLGGARRDETRNKIYKLVKELSYATTTQLQFDVGVGVDVITGHLRRLEKEGKLCRQRKGKRYVWSIKNANQCESRILQS